MQQLKRKVRGGNNPAAQLVKRIYESMETNAIPVQAKVKQIMHKRPNNVYRTDRKKYCEVIRPVNREKKAFLCRVYHTSQSSFTYPCDSFIIGHAQFSHQNYTIKTIEADKLTTRCLKLPSSHENKFVFIPLQHNYKE